MIPLEGIHIILIYGVIWMNELTAALGSHIRQLRNQKKVSQEELGYKASISAAHLGQIERGQKKPTVETLGRIASALDISVSELFRFDTPISVRQSSETMDKINAYLLSMTEEQRRDILKIIKIFKHDRENE